MDGGILSQDEINALLSGMDLSGDDPSSDSSAPAGDSNQELLSDIEKDAIGEVANISMGTSATTLYSLVNKRVDITTPTVKILKWEELLGTYDRPCVFININYTVGLDGSNILILKEDDVKILGPCGIGGFSIAYNAVIISAVDFAAADGCYRHGVMRIVCCKFSVAGGVDEFYYNLVGYVILSA